MKNSDKVTLTIGQIKKLIKESKTNKTWYGVPGTKFIWNGEWADPEIEYDGEILNANEVENFAWGIYSKDCQDDGKEPNEDEFDNLPIKFFKDALDDYIMGMNESLNEGVKEDYDAVAKMSLVHSAFDYLCLRKMQELLGTQELEDYVFKNFGQALADVRGGSSYGNAKFELSQDELEKMYSEFVPEKQKEVSKEIRYLKTQPSNW